MLILVTTHIVEKKTYVLNSNNLFCSMYGSVFLDITTFDFIFTIAGNKGNTKYRKCQKALSAQQTFWPGKLLGRSFQNALRAFWGEARKGFGVH